MSEKNFTVSCQHIYKSYFTGDIEEPVLKDANLNIEHGSLVILLGRSGSGKTTLLSIIGGILKQDSGISEILGKSLSTMPSNQKQSFIAENIGFVFQRLHLISELTAVENVTIPLLLNGDQYHSAYNLGLKYLEQVELAQFANRSPRLLSGGQQQRVAIARALVHQPKFVIADEPSSSLDNYNTEKIMKIFKGLAEKDKVSFLIATNDPRLIPYADQIYTIINGKIQTYDRNNDHLV